MSESEQGIERRLIMAQQLKDLTEQMKKVQTSLDTFTGFKDALEKKELQIKAYIVAFKVVGGIVLAFIGYVWYAFKELAKLLGL